MQAADELAHLGQRQQGLIVRIGDRRRTGSGTSVKRALAMPRFMASETSRCCAPSCRSRSIRRRSASVAATISARLLVSDSSRSASSSLWLGPSSALARRSSARATCWASQGARTAPPAGRRRRPGGDRQRVERDLPPGPGRQPRADRPWLCRAAAPRGCRRRPRRAAGIAAGRGPWTAQGSSTGRDDEGHVQGDVLPVARPGQQAMIAAPQSRPIPPSRMVPTAPSRAASRSVARQGPTTAR